MSVKQNDVGSSPAHDQKLFMQVFICLVRLFLAIFLNVSKGSPFHFFPILQKNGCSKTPKGPLLHFSALCDLPETKKSKKIEKKFKKKSNSFSIFSSRWYCKREYLTY